MFVIINYKKEPHFYGSVVNRAQITNKRNREVTRFSDYFEFYNRINEEYGSLDIKLQTEESRFLSTLYT